jgi:hypothetical protein
VPAPGDYDHGEIGGGENLPQCHFVHHKPHMLCPDANPGRRGRKPATNRLSYGTALLLFYFGPLTLPIHLTTYLYLDILLLFYISSCSSYIVFIVTSFILLLISLLL